MKSSKSRTRRSVGLPFLGWITLPFLPVLAQAGNLVTWTLWGVAAIAPFVVLGIHLLTSKNIRLGGVKTTAFHHGRPGRVLVEVHNDNTYDLLDMAVHCLGAERNYEGPGRDLLLNGKRATWVAIPIPPTLLKRGEHPAGTLRVKTGYPFNLFFTHLQRWDGTPILVYPAVEDGAPDWPAHHHIEKRKSREGEDIVGHRDYRVGDPLRHVDWKLSARNGGLVVREFERTIPLDLVFSTDQVKDLEFEHGLSRLTAWIVRAEKQGRRYGLDLYGHTIASSSGQAHMSRCLGALARLPTRGAA